MKKICIIGATPHSLVNFRGELIKSFVQKKFSVVALACGASVDEVTAIEFLGARYIDVPINRTSTNPFTDLNTMRFFEKVFGKEKPDYVIAYTIKPVIWGALAARKFPKIQFTALITGLGYAFERQGLKHVALHFITSHLYKASLKRANQVVFQNNDDFRYFVGHGLLDAVKGNVVSGSGVPLEYFKYQPLPNTKIVFLMVTRLLKEKGVFQFVEAACRVKSLFPHVRFQLLGGLDPLRGGINQGVVDKWVQQGCIEYLGETNDVRPYFSKSHVFVLPSYYREGLPRTILEAMSIGRPILTTDNVGCREPVCDGVNGFLIPTKNIKALAEKMVWFIENPDQIRSMGLVSRKIAEEKFDVHKVNARMFEIMLL